MNSSKLQSVRLEWVDGLKAFAIVAILYNHFIELYFGGPWFSNPSYNWPDFTTRMEVVFPQTGNIFASLAIFIGWLGDMGPGVFIFLSGFTLALSQDKSNHSTFRFYKKRLLRIFPLYITIHILILILFYFTKPGFEFDKIKIVFSLLGLRFTDGLFFYLNPSWWFIGLIVQLYIVFPFLFPLLKRNKRMFLVLSLIFTILCRLAGLLHFTYSENLYYWMTGLFFGTRLFEFTLGMYFAEFVFQKSNFFFKLINNKLKILLLSLTVYIAGFICSLFYFGTLVSNILITVGLSGIFFTAYECFRQRKIRSVILSVGVLSFPVFLLHQPLINAVAAILPYKLSVLANIFVLVICFPVGYILNLSIESGIMYFKIGFARLKSIMKNIQIGRILYILLVVLLLVILFDAVSDFGQSIDKICFAASFPVLFLIYLRETNFLAVNRFSFSLLLIVLYVFFIILLPFQWIDVLAFVTLPGIVIAAFVKKLKSSVWFCAFYFSLAFIVVFYAENQYRKNQYIEIGRWGEYPALQTDNQTWYSLKPNKITRLKYNNYDYLVKTNSLGFNSPEVDLSLPKDSSEFRIFVVGDAFSMPEALEYESAYSFLLEKELQNKYPGKLIRVFNGGVTGYGPNEMLRCVQKFIDTLKPDLIVNEIFVNEFLEVNLTEDERLESIGLNQTGFSIRNFDYSQFSYQINKNIRKVFRVEKPENKYKKSLLYFYEKNSEYLAGPITAKLDRYLSELKNIADSGNSKLMIMYVPGQIEVCAPEHISYYPADFNLRDTNQFDFDKPNKIIKDLCRKNQLFLFDTEDTLKHHTVQPVYYIDSWHWNAEGHRVISFSLSQIINPYQ